MSFEMKSRVSTFAFATMLASTACTPDQRDQTETATATPSHEPRTFPVPGRPVLSARPAAPTMHGPEEPKDGEALVWKKPDAWQDVSQPNPMRKATYRVKAPAGKPTSADAGTSSDDDAELAVAEAGGDLEANIKRWAGQFKESPTPKETKKKVGDLDVTIVELEGTYAGMAMPGKEAEPKTGYALLAAIVETPIGMYFFKLTGPKKTVDSARGDFDKLVESFHKP